VNDLAPDDLAPMALASAYQADILATLNRLGRTTDYWPTRAYQAIGRRAPRVAVAYVAEQVQGAATDGLRRLAALGRLSDSFEASVLDERWASLFDEETRTAARRRLDEVTPAPLPGTD
jgi:hypothetical protein